MNIEEVKRNIVVLCDTREIRSQHILCALNDLGIKFKQKKLNFGDYSFELYGMNFENICVIERKAHLTELSGNFCSGRMRFAKEFEKAKEAGAKVTLICEDANGKAKMLLRREIDKPKDIKGKKNIILQNYVNSLPGNLTERAKEEKIEKFTKRLEHIGIEKYIHELTWRSNFTANSFINSISSWKERYNLTVQFVDKKDTASCMLTAFYVAIDEYFSGGVIE